MSTQYVIPYIDSTGLNLPTFQGDQNYLIQQAQQIFGQNIYLAPDSQDGQWIAAVALMVYQTQQAIALAYNNQSPATAIGTGLDSIVAINGLTRLPATNSIVTVTISGTPFTVISNGICSDINGNFWNLPAQVIIGSTGTIGATATAQASGPVTALGNQITGIATPTSGWVSVTNPNAATAGTAVETDSALRARQAESVSNPSQALTTGILGGVLAVPGVTDAILYENDTGGVLNYVGNGYNPGGFPPHSITIVVNGGVGQTIADTIFLRKTPGCYTAGSVTYNFTDQYGIITPIRFYPVTTEAIYVTILIENFAGYTSAIGAQVQTAIAAYINGLAIGQTVLLSAIEYAAMSVNGGQQYPYFGVVTVLAGISSPSGTSDIAMQFNQQATTVTTNIIVGLSAGTPTFQFFLTTNTQNLATI
jgi:uncharacterized phage protein gp47/JayE